MRDEVPSPGVRVWLVYARARPDGPEPLVAVAASESEARRLERDIRRRDASIRVTWERHEVEGSLTGPVYVVSLGASGVSAGEETDPIGVAVHARRDTAEWDAEQRRRDQGDPHYLVRSLPLDWRREGWPFD